MLKRARRVPAWAVALFCALVTICALHNAPCSALIVKVPFAHSYPRQLFESLKRKSDGTEEAQKHMRGRFVELAPMSYLMAYVDHQLAESKICRQSRRNAHKQGHHKHALPVAAEGGPPLPLQTLVEEVNRSPGASAASWGTTDEPVMDGPRHACPEVGVPRLYANVRVVVHLIKSRYGPEPISVKNQLEIDGLLFRAATSKSGHTVEYLDGLVSAKTVPGDLVDSFERDLSKIAFLFDPEVTETSSAVLTDVCRSHPLLELLVGSGQVVGLSVEFESFPGEDTEALTMKQFQRRFKLRSVDSHLPVHQTLKKHPADSMAHVSLRPSTLGHRHGAARAVLPLRDDDDMESDSPPGPQTHNGHEHVGHKLLRLARRGLDTDSLFDGAAPGWPPPLKTGRRGPLSESESLPSSAMSHSTAASPGPWRPPKINAPRPGSDSWRRHGDQPGSAMSSGSHYTPTSSSPMYSPLSRLGRPHNPPTRLRSAGSMANSDASESEFSFSNPSSRRADSSTWRRRETPSSRESPTYFGLQSEERSGSESTSMRSGLSFSTLQRADRADSWRSQDSSMSAFDAPFPEKASFDKWTQRPGLDGIAHIGFTTEADRHESVAFEGSKILVFMLDVGRRHLWNLSGGV